MTAKLDELANNYELCTNKNLFRNDILNLLCRNIALETIHQFTGMDIEYLVADICKRRYDMRGEYHGLVLVLQILEPFLEDDSTHNVKSVERLISFTVLR